MYILHFIFLRHLYLESKGSGRETILDQNCELLQDHKKIWDYEIDPMWLGSEWGECGILIQRAWNWKTIYLH